MSQRSGTFREFQQHTLAIARGECAVELHEPRIWEERSESGSLSEAMQSAPTEEPPFHYLHSVLRERIVEHMFVAEALRRLWVRGIADVEVLRSEFDTGGYDLVMSSRKVVRHIQFKSTTEFGKAAKVNVSLKLAEKPSGCVIWIVVSPQDLEMKSYRWFGAEPGEPLPDIAELKVAKHTKANAVGIKLERPAHRVVPLAKFEKLETMDAVLERLFGPLRQSHQYSKHSSSA